MNKIMGLLIGFLLWMLSSACFGQIIAQCANAQGFGYYPYMGLIPEKSKDGLHEGWNEDSISNGIVQLNKINATDYDILFVDATKRIISSVSDGGTVLKVSQGEDSASFVVIYPGKTTEIFTFVKNKRNDFEFIQVTSRAGDDVPFIKSSLMRGDCEPIDFNAIK